MFRFLKSFYYSLPIRRKISISFILILLPILLTLVIVINRLSSEIIINETVKNTGQNLTLVIDKLDMLYNEIENYSIITILNNDLQKTLKQTISRSQSYDDTTAMRTILNNITIPSKSVDSLLVYQDNGNIFDSGNGITISKNLIEKRLHEFETLKNTQTTTIWLDTTNESFKKEAQNYDSISFLRTFNYANSGELLGHLEVVIDEARVSSLYSNIKIGETGYIYLINKSGKIISHKDKNMLYTDIRNLPYYNWAVSNEGYAIFEINNENVLVINKIDQKTGWFIIGIVPIKELTVESSKLTFEIFLIGFMSILLVIFFSEILSSTITKPIINLIESIKMVGTGDFEVQVNTHSKDELGVLSDEFNKMVCKTSTLMDRIIIEQKVKRHLELALLQSQIKPHFLYNTLESICGLAEINEKEKLIDTVNNLASFYRGVLSKGNEIIKIKDEIKIIDYYMRILKVRYYSNFDYNIDIQETIYEYSILKLCLQPLVENALYHGILNKQNHGYIEIKGCIKDDKIYFTVSDNGIGMREEQISNIFQQDNETIYEDKSFGLKSTHERIKLYFGLDYGLSIKSIYGEGTTVNVVIPARKIGAMTL